MPPKTNSNYRKPKAKIHILSEADVPAVTRGISKDAPPVYSNQSTMKFVTE